MLNLMIGKNSNLSRSMHTHLDNVISITTKSVEEELYKIEFDTYKTINVIFNNFQVSTALNDMSNPKDYIYRSISATANVLAYIKDHKIKVNKIIYTSSSSVYGNNIFCSETDQVQPLNLHASLKISNEMLIENFSKENNIDFTVMRVFNMYGGNDKFSIISKIINAHRNNTQLTIVNNGNSIRDFIHISDVVYIYKRLLTLNNIPYVNIGTGEGLSIKNILDHLKNNKIFLKSINIQKEELKISTANNEILLGFLGTYEFKRVEQYILEEILK